MTAKGKVGKQIESVIQEIEKNEQEEVVLKQKGDFLFSFSFSFFFF